MKGEILDLETAKRLHKEKPETPVDKKMYEANIKLVDDNKWLKKDNQELRERIKETIEYLEYQLSQLDFYEDTKAKMLGSMVIVLLQGSDKE